MIKVITDLSPLYRLAQNFFNVYCLASLKSTCARVTTNLGLRASILLTYVYIYTAVCRLQTIDTAHIWANTGVIERGVESTSVICLFTRCVGYFTSPGIGTR